MGHSMYHCTLLAGTRNMILPVKCSTHNVFRTKQEVLLHETKWYSVLSTPSSAKTAYMHNQFNYQTCSTTLQQVYLEINIEFTETLFPGNDAIVLVVPLVVFQGTNLDFTPPFQGLNENSKNSWIYSEIPGRRSHYRYLTEPSKRKFLYTRHETPTKVLARLANFNYFLLHLLELQQKSKQNCLGLEALLNIGILLS